MSDKFQMLNPRASIDMHSPEPISPSPSTPSSGSPPPEEANFNSQSYFSNLASHVTTALGRGSAGSSSSSKRRLPVSSYVTGPSDRDSKARKKSGDAGRSNSQYDGPREVASRKDKDELVDGGTVEWLRKGGLGWIAGDRPLLAGILTDLSVFYRNWRPFLRTGCQVLINLSHI